MRLKLRTLLYGQNGYVSALESKGSEFESHHNHTSEINKLDLALLSLVKFQSHKQKIECISTQW